MSMSTMYPPMVNSPLTTITAAITYSQTSVTVANGSALPAAPNLCTLGNGDNAETVYYSAKSGNVLTCQRGYDGTTAQAWGAGTQVSRNLTAGDLTALQNNINELNNVKTPKALVNNTVSSTAYTLAAGDADDRLLVTTSAATTITVPPSIFTVGTEIEIVQYGTGSVAIAAGSGVTIRSLGGKLSVTGQYGAVSLICTAANVWLLLGALG